MDIVKDLSELIDDCTNNEIDFKDLYYELISLKDKCSKQLILPDVINWVAIDDELPLDDENVIVYYTDNGGWVTSDEFNGKYFINENISGLTISHWARFPKPPCL